MSKLSLLVSCTALFSFAACSSDGGGDDGDDDPPAGVAVDADCATSTIAATIMTEGDAYSPASVTIAPDAVVKFVMPASHDVASSTSGLKVGFGATKCLKFATVGTYTFNCTPHQFRGTVKVQ